jgi:hypothetical protein
MGEIHGDLHQQSKEDCKAAMHYIKGVWSGIEPVTRGFSSLATTPKRLLEMGIFSSNKNLALS